MAIPTLTVTPSAAAQAYRAVDGLAGGLPGGQTGPGAAGSSFGSALARALDGVVKTGNAAESQAMKAIAGNGNITEMVSTVAQAELALQTTMVVRDRVVQAYQEIMRMPL